MGATATGLPWPIGGALALSASIIAALNVLPDLEPFGSHPRLLLWSWCAAMLVAAYFVADQSVFMLDATQSSHAYSPPLRPLDDEQLSKPFFPEHNCFTAYVVAACLANQNVKNIYDPEQYRDAENPTPFHEQIGTAFGVDRYQYPPPFLILPRALLATGGDFWQLRAYWHAINVSLLAVTLVTVALWVDRSRFHILWLLLPALFMTPLLRGSLQIQNVHVMIIAISLLALPAFDARKNCLGGALLGFAVVSKLFPGLLIIFLLLQRRWRAVAWTLGWMAAFGLLTLVLFGAEPFRGFIEFQMPRLASGDAFSFATTMIPPMLKNTSIMGVAYKLGLLDLAAEPKRLASILVWTYTLIILVLLLVVGLRRSGWATSNVDDHQGRTDRMRLARIWLAILVVGQLRSPFLPWTYGNVAVLMLLILLISERRNRLRNAWAIGSFALLILPIPLPWGPTDIAIDVWYTLVGLIVTLVAVGIALLERPAHVAESDMLMST